jgi:hypothetical protein
MPKKEVTVADDATTVASYIAASATMGCGHDATPQSFPVGAGSDACIHYSSARSQASTHPEMGN